MKNVLILNDVQGLPILINKFELVFAFAKYLPNLNTTKRVENFVFETGLVFKSGVEKVVYLKTNELAKIFDLKSVEKSVNV